MHFTFSLRYLLLFMLAIHDMLACAQLFTISNLPTQRQLPVANIHCMLQDSEGYMWYGTTGGGLCRDDGYQVVTLGKRHVAALSDNNVTCLAEDARHGICIGTQRGLYRVDKTNYSLLSLLSGRYASQSVSALFVDREGRLWVGLAGEVLRLSADGKLEKTYVLRLKGKRASVDCFGVDVDGKLFVGLKEGGICRYDFKADRWMACPWDYDYPPTKICIRGNDFLVGTWGGGIVSYSPRSGHCTSQTATLGTELKRQVLDIYRDKRQGLCWVTTMDDFFVYRYEGGQLRSLPLGGLLPDYRKILDQIVEDRDGNVWVAGFMPSTFIVSANVANIQRYEVGGMRTLTHYPLLADRVVADGGRYWIWQGRYGLTLYDPATDRVADAGGMRFARCIEK